MGITKVNDIVRAKSERSFVSVKVKSIKNKRIAIDAAIWLYANMAVAQRETVRRMKDLFEEIDRGDLMQHCIAGALKLFVYFLDNDIYPVWIRDGKTPKEKKETRAKRKETRDKRKYSIEELKEKISKQDVLLQNPKDLEELRKLMMYDINVFSEEYVTFYNTLEGFGVPIITAPGEAEAYACALNKKGIIYGIWTTDTDCYALEGVNMITGLNGKDEEGHDIMDVVHIPYILQDLEFDENQMRDFCIMCGTDFNLNIPNVGVTRAYDAISKHGSIEEYASNSKKDITILNHERSRELLSPPECHLELDSAELNLNIESFKEMARDLSEQYGLSQYYAKIKVYLNQDFEITKYEAKTGPHNKKKRIKVVINGQVINPVSEEKKKIKTETEFDDKITTLAELMDKISVKQLE